MSKKKYALVLAFVFCLAATLFIVVGTGYDPWIDYDDDGYIGSADAGVLNMHYGTSGDSRKTVYMKYSTYYWEGTAFLNPYGSWNFHNTTVGYRNMSIAVSTDATVEVQIDYHMPHVEGPHEFGVYWSCASFTVLYVRHRNFAVSEAPCVKIYVENPTPEVVSVTLLIYMTA